MLRCFRSLAAVLLCLPALAQYDNPRPTLTRWDIESMYTQAKAALEDPTITQVESVPRLLAVCSQQGYAPAARLLLDVYEGKFKGLAADPEKAANEAKTIAEVPVPFPDDPDCSSMHIEAMYRWALYQERGYGCEKNTAEAYRWMTEAAAAGLPAAKVERARMLTKGIGTERDIKTAWALLSDIAHTVPETPHVFFYMGYLCYSSGGTHAARRKAAELFYIGSRYHDADCMNNLGAMYEKGISVRRNTSKALQLYGKSAALGNKQASANMQRLSYKEGIEAHRQETTPAITRIGNATQRVIRILPINPKSQERLWAWLSGAALRPS